MRATSGYLKRSHVRIRASRSSCTALHQRPSRTVSTTLLQERASLKTQIDLPRAELALIKSQMQLPKAKWRTRLVSARGPWSGPRACTRSEGSRMRMAGGALRAPRRASSSLCTVWHRRPLRTSSTTSRRATSTTTLLSSTTTTNV